MVTNIDREHLDHYASLEEIRAAFIEFVNKVPFYGAAIVCLDDENVQSILPADQAPHHHLRPQRAGRHRSHATSAAATFASDFRLRYRDRRSGPFPPAHSRASTTC